MLRVSVIRLCVEYGVKTQTVSDVRRSKDKLTSYAMKIDVAPSKDRKGAAYKCKKKLHHHCHPNQAPALLKKPPAVLRGTFLASLTQSNTHYVSPLYGQGGGNYSPPHKINQI